MSLAPSHSGLIKAIRFRLPLPLLASVICILGFVSLFYTERISLLSSTSIFRLKSCSRRAAISKPSARTAEDNPNNSIIDDRFDFDPEECDIVNGRWVFNLSINPLYTDRTCPYLDRQVSCVKNGRLDSEYLHWEWQPDDCTLSRFNPETALKKLRGKRLMFVGDSLQRGQWQSFVCLVESIIPDHKKSMKRGRVHSIFSAKGYDATIEFYWAPFLVESNSDVQIIQDPKQRILSVDSVAKHSKHWMNVDILVFNTYVWWMSGLRINSLWGSFRNGKEGYQELDAPIAYTISLKTWANWVDSTLNPNKTRVFFTTMSPTHMRFLSLSFSLYVSVLSYSETQMEDSETAESLFFRSADWGNKNGTKCFNETRPVTERRFWGSGADKRIMSVVADIVGKMKVPVSLINITQISDYRIDGHSSIFTETGGQLLSEEQKADPLHNADCIHWCLPGVPDTWNQIFLAHL